MGGEKPGWCGILEIPSLLIHQTTANKWQSADERAYNLIRDRALETRSLRPYLKFILSKFQLPLSHLPAKIENCVWQRRDDTVATSVNSCFYVLAKFFFRSHRS